jgi:hypothetical protein
MPSQVKLPGCQVRRSRDEDPFGTWSGGQLTGQLKQGCSFAAGSSESKAGQLAQPERLSQVHPQSEWLL